MEHAGSSDTIEDAERKGLGTPATRAAINWKKLIEKGFMSVKRADITYSRWKKSDQDSSGNDQITKTYSRMGK